MKTTDDFKDKEYTSVQTMEPFLHAIYFISPVWAMLLFQEISLLPLPKFAIQTLAIVVICLLFFITAHAIYVAFRYEGWFINTLIVLLLGFILILSLLQRPFTFIFLSVAVTIPLSVCGALYALHKYSVLIKLIILALIVLIAFLPAGFLYWVFLATVADIFSIKIGP